MKIENNHIPKRITPDRLTDTIVEIEITSKFNKAMIESLMLEAIGHYQDSEFVKYEISNGEYLYANDTFRFCVTNNAISFNIVGGYPGWITYFCFIKRALQGLRHFENFVSFKKVRVNYISNFPEISVFDIWDGTPIILHNIPPHLERSFELKFGIYEKNTKKKIARADINLRDNLHLKDSDSNYSQIDIALESDDIKSKNVEDALEVLDIIHNEQKKAFYRLLSEDFINKLNPEW